MKKLFTLLILALTFVGNAMAWEPVIKETHWFGSIEYDEGNDPNDNYGGLNLTLNFDGNNIKDIRGWASNHQGANATPPFGDRHFQTTFNCWQDDSESNPKPRFRVNVTSYWEVGRNNSNTYHGIGLKVKESVGSTNGTNFWIQNLDAGDKFIIEYYRVANATRMPFLVSGIVTGRTTNNTEWSKEGEIAGGPEYECPNGGEVCINIPGGTVIRGVTIIHSNNCYKKATSKIEQIRDNQNNIGYEMTLTGSGVLEEKRGAVPYITMRFGDMNDMTYVKYLGTFNGEKKYGASSIVDAKDDLNPVNQNMQQVFKDHGEDWTKKKLIGKEWTVFTNNREILPLYGTYYYFFPEVDGKFNVKFYCEGDLEHLPLWYKFDANDGLVPFTDQLHLEMKRNGVTINSGDPDGKFFIGGNTKYDQPYYEYTVDFKKGGVYYLCSNPNNYDMERPVVRLMSYGFIPTFRVDPLYSVVENGSTKAENAATIKGVTIKEFTGINNGGVFNNEQKITINGDENAPMIKFLGNVTGATIKLKEVNGDIKLDFKDITYKEGNNINKGGAIVVNLDCPAGRATYVLTVAYKAAKAEWGKDSEGKDLRVATNETGNVEVKKWDFFSKPLAVGTYGTDDGTRYDTDKSAWLAKSLLFREVHKADGLTADWEDTYVDLQNSKERIFKSVYDMEGDNADMIKETEGLLLHTEANKMGIFNENPAPSNGFQDRFIGLMSGSKLVIPRLQANDRVVIKMGSFGNADDAVTNKPATLTLTNAKDANGTAISGDYVIGGSIPYDGETDPHGEYHFMVKETSNSDATDFAIEVKDADLLKIYSIVIYRNAANNNADILTENYVTADKQEVLFTDQDAEDATEDVTCTLRYRGYEEPSTFNGIDQVRGNLDATSMTFTPNTADNSVKTTLKRGDFGSFRAKMAVKTKDAGNTYVTDYAPGNMAVGYRETMEYPYTWDFTDLYSYVEQPIGFERQASNLDEEHKGWESYQDAWCLRNAPQNELGILFANGGQLYGANKMFDETAGLGFKRSTDVLEDIKKLNKGVGVTNTTLKLDNPEYSSDNTEFHKIVVPQVDEDAYIYVRATPVAHATVIAKYSTDGVSSSDFTKTLDVEGDKVYIMRNTTKQDVELWLNGVAIKKIGVSRDLKTVNVKGYASESRAYRIDHSLTNFFSGKKVKAYVVQDANYENRTLKLFDITSDTAPVLAANQGCIIGTNDEKLEVIDGGFHLFAPDMHDTGNYLHETYGNMLKANVETEGLTLGMFNGDNTTNYVLAYKYQMLKEDGTPYGDVIEGDEMFYRVSKKGIKLHKNSAYLPLPTAKVKPSASNPAGCPMFTFIFTELDEGETVITGIEEAGVVFEDEEANAVWYNLNGQKLNGKPSARGIYIRNGKKVFVK